MPRSSGDQRARVVRGALQAEGPEEDAVAVAVVEERRGEVVERVRIAEGAARVGPAALRHRMVAADQPDLAVERRGEDVAAARRHRAQDTGDDTQLIEEGAAAPSCEPAHSCRPLERSG